MKKCEEEVKMKIPEKYKSIFKMAEVKPIIYNKIKDFLEKCPEEIIDALDREEFKVKAKNKYGTWQLGYGARNEIVIYRDIVDEKTSTPGDSSLFLSPTDDDLFEMDFPSDAEYLEGDIDPYDLGEMGLLCFFETKFNIINKQEVHPVKDYYQLYSMRVSRNIFLSGYEGNNMKEEEMSPVKIKIPNHPNYIERQKKK